MYPLLKDFVTYRLFYMKKRSHLIKSVDCAVPCHLVSVRNMYVQNQDAKKIKNLLYVQKNMTKNQRQPTQEFDPFFCGVMMMSNNF